MIVAYVLVVACVAVLACFHYFSDDQKRRRAIRSALPVAIAEAQAGRVVKLTGRVAYLTEPLLAPLSQRPCAYYLVTVDEYRSSGKSGSWVNIIRDTAGVDFLLEDGTGRARVVNQSMAVVAVSDAKYTSGVLDEPTPELQAYLAKHDKTSTGWIFNKSMRYHEAVFEAGETVAIVGQVGFERDPGGVPDGTSYRSTPQRAVIAAPPGGSLLASDDPALVGVAGALAR